MTRNDLLCDTEVSTSNLFHSFNRYITAEEDRGKVWQTLVYERTGDMSYSMHRLTDRIARNRLTNQITRKS